MKDYFAAKFDNSGAFKWLKNGGGNQNDSGINISQSGTKILVFGTFSTTGFFDKNIITSSNGNPNTFLHKIEE